MIKTILFDMGGVVITLAQPQAIERFKALGLKDAEERLDAYTQQGIFGDLEARRRTILSSQHTRLCRAPREVQRGSGKAEYTILPLQL